MGPSLEDVAMNFELMRFASGKLLAVLSMGFVSEWSRANVAEVPEVDGQDRSHSHPSRTRNDHDTS